MIPVLIEKHRRELSAVCRRYRVQRLDLFGSAATPRFDPAASDLDFVVVFADEAASGLADRYLDLAETLERIFQRRVDLLTERSIRNPYFKQTVESTRQGVYEHPGEEATV